LSLGVSKRTKEFSDVAEIKGSPVVGKKGEGFIQQ